VPVALQVAAESTAATAARVGELVPDVVAGVVDLIAVATVARHRRCGRPSSPASTPQPASHRAAQPKGITIDRLALYFDLMARLSAQSAAASVRCPT
jgi:L-lactate permease